MKIRSFLREREREGEPTKKKCQIKDSSKTIIEMRSIMGNTSNGQVDDRPDAGHDRKSLKIGLPLSLSSRRCKCGEHHEKKRRRIDRDH